jgi:vacuolar-type H+-ATPase subunit I/STV1
MEEIIKTENLIPQEAIPKINLNIENKPDKDTSNIISDDQLLDIYKEILENIREDRKQISEFIDNFADMVINEGDSTSSSKESLVNLVKAKTEISDKMSKVADLMTRIKLKDRDTYPKYLAASQNNTINISSNKRQLIEAINKKRKTIDET